MSMQTTADTALLRWQQSMLAALWAPTHDEAVKHLATPDPDTRHFMWRGIAAYRSHAAGQAVRSLGSAYPAVARLLGAENFDGLARLFWREQAPQRGDLAHWGAAFALQIEGLPELVADLPFLADLARLEWGLHSLATVVDGRADPASLALLARADPAMLHLDLAPGVACFSSAWPVVTLMASQDGASAELPRHGETALIWRSGWRPMLRQVQSDEPAFLQAAQAGQSLAAALEGAASFDFGAWLLPAVNEGLLLRVVETK